MGSIGKGKPAPEISLPGMNGDRFSLAEARQRGPVLAAFFKVSCPTCQYTFPFLERLYQAYPSDKVTVVGISQNPREETAQFAEKFGITFPLYLDDTRTYPVSNSYGLTNVPSLFFISPEGRVEQVTVGWLRSEIDELNKRLAAAAAVPKAQVFAPGEEVVDYMAG
ncbi:MAG TPA: TlpA disulfide reductase family protein [Terriglobales bacterium]|nr:TlpA disulfide reductase family protein [Terriglobales bacterium]